MSETAQQFRVAVTEHVISVSFVSEHLSSGVASADRYGVDLWWVSRVYIRPTARAKGLGSIMLEKLKEAFAETATPRAVLLVCPGGYGENIERQQNFYVKNGFRQVLESDQNVFAWAPRDPPLEELEKRVRELLREPSTAEDTPQEPAPLLPS